MLWNAMRLGLVAAVLPAGNAAAQLAEPKEVISNGGINHTLQAAPVMGQPFSAEQVQETARTLNDGTNISHFGHHAVMRDSVGRVRVEQPCGCRHGEIVTAVFVLDPVARTLTTWRTGGGSETVAVVKKLPETLMEPKPQPVRVAVPNPNRPNPDRPQPIVSSETLPVEYIENLPMTVTKTTTVVPAGRSGNDAPITRTHEVWTSTDLKLTFREQWVDPRAATRTVELAKFSRTEPDPALFRAPANYTVKDVKQAAKELADQLQQMGSNL